MIERREADNVISATDAKNNFGNLLSQVADSGEPVVVERQGKPRAAIISMEQYRELRAFQKEQRRREAVEALRQLRSEISSQNRDLSDEQIEEFAQRVRDDVMQAVVDKYSDSATDS